VQADPEVRVEVVGRLDAHEVDAVALLVERATEADGVRPLSEHVVLHLQHGGDRPGRNVMAYVGPHRLAGYAHVDVTDQVAGSSAEVVVDPRLRGRRIGRRLVEQAFAESPDNRLRLWSHGGLPAADALARSMGLTSVRRLWQMRRPLTAPLPPVELPDGVRVRTFRPGADDAEWLAVNLRAFADHPEQGRWTLDDLHRRMAEPWFDPAGFFLAVRDGDGAGDGDGAAGRIVGFHWTKVHGTGGHGHPPIGEVYVVGVDPSEQGHGLGRTLTLVGLHHLRDLGLREAMLYVDEDNTAAVRTYDGLGFVHTATDVMYSGEGAAG
jgi:mycothiol synthase